MIIIKILLCKCKLLQGAVWFHSLEKLALTKLHLRNSIFNKKHITICFNNIIRDDMIRYGSTDIPRKNGYRFGEKKEDYIEFYCQTDATMAIYYSSTAPSSPEKCNSSIHSQTATENVEVSGCD
ncbi:hypothetical protein ILYODFUR_033283 [Ilyodon furcidens]|uniref:Uncharacterized protein n=1 Tax=Ilyodon furcidens TaxID=33524 RepID=A0ABV0UD73_9TELE